MRKRKRSGLLMLVPGLCLMAFAAFQLITAPVLLQYIMAAPDAAAIAGPEAAPAGNADPAGDSQEPGEAPVDAPVRNVQMEGLLEKIGDKLQDISGSLTAWTVSADKANFSFANDSGGGAEARLCAAGERYFEVYPHYLLSGRLPDPDELKYGDMVIVLDIDLAIKLFGISEPIDRVVKIGDASFRVAGVVRHGRAPGEYDLYTGYIPLAAAVKLGIALDSVTVSAVPQPGSGAGSAFNAAMTEVSGNGDYYDLSKESLRQRVLLRLVLVALAGWLLSLGFAQMNRFAAARFGGYRERLRREYLRDMMGGMLLNALMTIAGYALLLACCWGVATYAIQPVYVFPEWVPAVLVEWNDIQATFWDLVTRAAKPVKRFTPELKRIEFYGVLLRWGLIMSLVGGLLASFKRRFFMRPY